MLFKNKYRIESSRLKGYDYSSPGAYSITIITKNRKRYFGHVEKDKMILNEFGKMVNNFWKEIPKHFPYAILDEYIVMPNHVHGIIILDDAIETNSLGISSDDFQTKNSVVETPKNYNVETPKNYNVETPKNYNVETPKLGVSTKNRQPIGVIINQFKRICTIEIRKYEINFGWQSRFHDHIIRNEKELNRIRQYIIDNPMNWKSDDNFISNGNGI